MYTTNKLTYIPAVLCAAVQSGSKSKGGEEKQARGGLSGNMKGGGVDKKGWGDEAFDKQTAQGLEEKETLAAKAKQAKYQEYEEVGGDDGARQRKKPPAESGDSSGKGSMFLGGKSAFNNSVKRSGKTE
jgi:hypothetical protein